MAINSTPFKIILGSSSVARRQILSEMGYEFEIKTAGIDERAIRKEKPEELVTVLAEAKADAILSRLEITDYKNAEPTLLITSDIVVVHEGSIREKPTTQEEARQFLKGYSGSHITTVNYVHVVNLKTGKRNGGLDKAEVYFYQIPDEVIQSLIGASDSVMGLPKALTEKLIQEALTEE